VGKASMGKNVADDLHSSARTIRRRRTDVSDPSLGGVREHPLLGENWDSR
jgi:hypothetical protein